MAHWLSAAKRAFQNQPAKEPERFEICCACGTQVAGVRTREAQRVACPTCSQVLLVLPESLYPLPKPPRAKKPKAAAKPAVAKAKTPLAASAVTEKFEKADTKNSISNAPSSSPAPGRALAQTKAAVQEVGRKVFNRRLITPLRAVTLLMLLALGLTGYWMLRQRERDLASQTLTDALKAGRKALEDDDLPEANSEFQKAVKALDTLDRRDASSQGTRQTSRELTVMNQLAAKSLRDLLVEAAETAGSGNAAAWPDIFRASYRDRWIVVDAQVTPQAAEDLKAPSDFLVDLPIAAGENRLVLLLKTRGLTSITRDGAPRRMIVGARLRDCQRDPGQSGTWRLEFDETSPFLWTDASLLTRLGWTRDATLEKLLQDQARAEGLER